MTAFKNNFKLLPILFILLLISLISILFLQYDRNKLKNETVNRQTLFNSLIRDSNSRAKLEGKELYKLLDLPKDTFFSVLKTSVKEFNIFIVVDSIDCYTCFGFHVEHINNFSKKNIPIISYSYLHSDYLNKSLYKSIIFPFNEGYRHKIINNSNMVILLINNEGKIIYADVADKTNYKKSKIFYNKIDNLIFNE